MAGIALDVVAFMAEENLKTAPHSWFSRRLMGDLPDPPDYEGAERERERLAKLPPPKSKYEELRRMYGQGWPFDKECEAYTKKLETDAWEWHSNQALKNVYFFIPSSEEVAPGTMVEMRQVDLHGNMVVHRHKIRSSHNFFLTLFVCSEGIEVCPACSSRK